MGDVMTTAPAPGEAGLDMSGVHAAAVLAGKASLGEGVGVAPEAHGSAKELMDHPWRLGDVSSLISGAGELPADVVALVDGALQPDDLERRDARDRSMGTTNPTNVTRMHDARMGKYQGIVADSIMAVTEGAPDRDAQRDVLFADYHSTAPDAEQRVNRVGYLIDQSLKVLRGLGDEQRTRLAKEEPGFGAWLSDMTAVARVRADRRGAAGPSEAQLHADVQ